WFQSETGLHQNWMRDYDPTTGGYMQADPLGLVDGASVYGYALQNPGRYVDPTGEFIPVLIGIGIGFLLDTAINAIEEYCGCEPGILPSNKYTAAGGAFGGVGPFATKPRGGIAGGGKSGERTSWTSTGSFKQRTRFGRDAGPRFSWGIPIMGAGFLLYNAYRLWHCLEQK
ncbi:RHS repeat-associated core domain-containing protein, partial [Yoonia sp. 76]